MEIYFISLFIFYVNQGTKIKHATKHLGSYTLHIFLRQFRDIYNGPWKFEEEKFYRNKAVKDSA